MTPLECLARLCALVPPPYYPDSAGANIALVGEMAAFDTEEIEGVYGWQNGKLLVRLSPSPFHNGSSCFTVCADWMISAGGFRVFGLAQA